MSATIAMTPSTIEWRMLQTRLQVESTAGRRVGIIEQGYRFTFTDSSGIASWVAAFAAISLSAVGLAPL